MFIKAIQTAKRSVTYLSEDGSSETRVGGDWTWRNQNPGNLGAGAWANRHGAIGKAGGFAVFADYDTGKKAIFELLQGPDFSGLSIWDAIPRYAPSSDHNNVKWYRQLVSKATGLDLKKRKINSLNQKELTSLVNAIERAEGKFKPGKITKQDAKKKISGVQKNKKGTIVAYRIEGFGWIDKQKAIALVKRGKVDAVVSHSRSGTLYLKARPDKATGNNLGTLA